MFDPYYKWLGIPVKDQPPNHYRLLGLELFEPDPDVIERAADRQMAFIRSYATGAHVSESQRLLNEIASARVCLLNADKKSNYDTALRQTLATREVKKPSAPAVIRVAAGTPTAQDAISIDVGPGLSSRTTRRQGFPTGPLIGITAALVAVVVALLLFAGNGRPFDAPADSRTPQQVRSLDPNLQSQPRIPAAPTQEQVQLVSPSVDGGPTDSLVSSAQSSTTDEHVLDSPRGERDAPAAPTADTSAARAATSPTQSSNAEDLSPSVTRSLPSPPTGRALEDAERLFQEVYGGESASAKTAQQQSQLADKLWKQAGEENDLAIQYVLLRESGNAAASAGEAASALRAIQAIGTTFQVDLLPLQMQVLRQTARRATSNETSKVMAEGALVVVQQAIDADRYADAKELSDLALTAARTSKDAALIKQAAATGKRVATLTRHHASIAEARAVLETAPDDPHANAVVGRFLCLIKGDWERGLPALAKGDDAVLKALAERDGTAAKDASQQVAIGDAWWELAEADGGDAKPSVQARAAHWYGTALPQLTGLARTRVEKRLSSIDLAEWAVPRPQTVSERTVSKATPGTQENTKQVVTDIIGHSGYGNEFRDVAPRDRVLVGFNVTFGRYGTSDAEAVGSLQPIYGSAQEAAPSAVIGNKSGKVTSVTARQGFAVAGVRVHANTRILGFQLVFAKRKGTQFDMSTAYTSDWIGRPNDASPLISSQRNSVVGITGWWAKESIRSLGLICGNAGQSE